MRRCRGGCPHPQGNCAPARLQRARRRGSRAEQNQAAIAATGIPPTADHEAALLITLGSDSYTVVVRGKNDTSGVGLVEVHDLSETADSRLANISTRGRIATGQYVMIGGFIIGGNGPRGIVRALWPSLLQAGLSRVLGDPRLSIRDPNGEEIAANDGWKPTSTAKSKRPVFRRSTMRRRLTSATSAREITPQS